MKTLKIKTSEIIGLIFFAFILVLVGSLVYAAISGQVDLNNW